MRALASLALAVLLVPLGAGGALAQDAPATPAAPEVVGRGDASEAKADSVEAQVADWLNASPHTELVDDSVKGVVSGRPDRRIHGEVGFSVGTGGYRSAYGVAVMPVGQTGSLAVAVEDSEFGKHWGGGKRQSLAIALDLGGSSGGSPPPGCAPGVRVGDRYLEPLWLTQMRAASLAREMGDCLPTHEATKSASTRQDSSE